MELEAEDEQIQKSTGPEKLELGSSRMFYTSFALSSIELVLKCSAFGINRTVLSHFSRAVIDCQIAMSTEESKENDDGEEESANQGKVEDGGEQAEILARQRYFRHLVYWLSSDVEQEIPIVIQDAYVRMMCILLKPREIDDMLHDRFTIKSQKKCEIPPKPTDTVLLLIQWFIMYFKRYPELHMFSSRISPVVQAIDQRLAFDLSQFFVRDHIFLLLLQVLNAYNQQRTWMRRWDGGLFQDGPPPPSEQRGGPNDQPPNPDKVRNDFYHMVTKAAFLAHDKTAGDGMEEGQDDEDEAQDDEQDGVDLIGDVFEVLFDQSDWFHVEWAIQDEMQMLISQVLAFGLNTSAEIGAADDLVKRLQKMTGGEEVNSESSDSEEEEEDTHVATMHQAHEEFGELKKATQQRLGRHEVIVEDDQYEYAPVYRKFLGLDDPDRKGDKPPDPVLPRGLRLPMNDKQIDEEEHMRDFLYELVELPDAELVDNLRIDVNLWRRQQLVHRTFKLESSSEVLWRVEEDLKDTLGGIGLRLFHKENIVQELQMELHVHRELRATHVGMSTSVSSGPAVQNTPSLSKKKGFVRAQKASSAGVSKEIAQMQVYFEVEVNGTDVVYLENLAGHAGRKKVSLQLVGARTVTMRTRCLIEQRGLSITVANPRIMVLISPTNFELPVVRNVINIGQRKHAQSMLALPSDPNDPNNPAVTDLKDEDLTVGNKITKKVIHDLMPKFKMIVVDLVEELCFGLKHGGQKGIDYSFINRTLEKEHVHIISMMNKACSYVMRDQLLEKLDMERGRDWEIQLQATYPNLTQVFEALHEHSLDDEAYAGDDIPMILKEAAEKDTCSETLRNWILRICHVIRTVAFLKQPRLDPEQILSPKDKNEGDRDIFEEMFDDTGDNRMVRVTCSALLNILQEIFTHDEFIEEKWEKWTQPQQATGQFFQSFVVEKALFFCPFSLSKGTKKEEEALVPLKMFFEEAQEEVIDPLKLVPVMLYHPDVWLRLESLKLGCSLLQDANASLQQAFKQFDSPHLNLQKAMAFQFHNFINGSWDEDNVQATNELLKKIQTMCEGHNFELQSFIGEDLSIEEKDFATLIAEFQEEQEEADDDDFDKKDGAAGPANLVDWICTMAQGIIEKMRQDQQWQASMVGREQQYSLLAQLFETAAEIIQGPSRGNQRLLLNGEILLNVCQLWKRQRIDEFKFRDLIQDNEDLFVMWMELLNAMRICEISVLKFVLSLLEEEELDAEDANFRQISEEVVEHKGYTIRRMVEELDPKIICDKIITHWNLCAEVRDEKYIITPVQDPDETIEHDTAERIFRPKREVEAEGYLLEEQEDHCLEISFLCWALFEGVKETAQFKDRNLFTEPIERMNKDVPTFNPQHWNGAKTKIYDTFTSAVTSMHHSKYLHFLFGRIEILRGPRLQKLFFLVPRPIRYMKDHALIKQWQENLINMVDRTGPEAKMQDFSERVRDEYIEFVKHQYMLSGKPFPLNSAGSVIAQSENILSFLTVVMTLAIAFVYTGSYSETHHFGQYAVHYPKSWYVLVFSGMGCMHLTFCVIILLFHVVAYSQWIINKGLEQWKDDNPNDHHKLGGPFILWLMLYFFVFEDTKMMYQVMLAAISFCGLHFDFLFFSFHNLHVCSGSATLGKVFEAFFNTWDQVVGTVGLGFSIQYCFLVLGFMSFSKGYGFADMDTSGCDTLLSCLLGHLDYGNRSAPVWDKPDLTWFQFIFDYMYNLFVILILAAIISGIIIDAFSTMRADLKERTDDQKNNCFVCYINRSLMERKMVKFETHVFQDHYMWSYARFLMYLKEAPDSTLNGPESYVKEKVANQDYQFYPINRALSLDSEDAEEYGERTLKVKDLEEFRGFMKQTEGDTEAIIQIEREMKTGLKDTRGVTQDLMHGLSTLQTDMQKRGIGEVQVQDKKPGGAK